MSGRRLWRRTARQVEGEVEEEIRFHLEARIAELERAGMSPVEARAEAERRFGDHGETLADCLASDLRRDRRAERREVIADLVQDARLGMRQLKQRPLFTAVAVATLGVAIGANATIYAFADHILVRPLPYASPDRVMTLWETDAHSGARMEVSPATFLDWRERSRTFSTMALAEPYSVDVTGEGAPAALPNWLVTEGYFEALGVRPILGRLFEPGDHASGAAMVGLVSHGAWQNRFGGTPEVLGRTVTLDGTAVEIVGVLPPSLEYPDPREVWLPKRMRPDELLDRRSSYMFAIGRLADGVTIEQAQSELNAIAAQLSDEHAGNRNRGVAIVALEDRVLGGVRPAVTVLLVGAGLLLLIACANLANLLVSRGLERSGELAVRGALGAGRARLARQLTTESLVLSLLGGLAGGALAYAGIRLLVAAAPPELPRLNAVTLDSRVLLFLVITTMLAGALFGVMPALRLSRPDLMGVLRSGRGLITRDHERMRRVLMTAQIALCCVLLIGAGLLARSLRELSSNELGFDPQGRATLQAHIWDNNPTAAQRVLRVQELEARFAALPGVLSAGAVTSLPFHPYAIDAMGGLLIEGAEPDDPATVPRVRATIVTPRYFETMSIPLASGRSFDDRDAAGTPAVVIINEALARTYFPGEDPVGRRITGGVMAAPVTRTIVGVVGDVRPSAFDSEPAPEMYVPHAQNASGSLTFVVRTRGDAALLIEPMRRAVWDVDPAQSIYHAATVEQLVRNTLAGRRFQLLLGALFALAATGLILLGIYGVVALWVRQRQQEFGLRLALGAERHDIVRLVIGQALRIALPGVALGLVLSLAAARAIAHMLYGVQPIDAPTWSAVTVLLVVAASAAAYVPARAAARAAPQQSMSTNW